MTELPTFVYRRNAAHSMYTRPMVQSLPDHWCDASPPLPCYPTTDAQRWWPGGAPPRWQWLGAR